jgi:hypothetical protein
LYCCWIEYCALELDEAPIPVPSPAAGRADRGTPAAADRRAKSGPEHRGQGGRADTTRVGVVRLAGDRLLGELLANRLVILERVERFAGTRHDVDGRPHRRLRAGCQQQDRAEDSWHAGAVAEA